MTVEVGARGASRGIPGPRQRFAMAAEQFGDGTSVVSVMGELDLATVPAFERRLLDVTEAGTGEVIVDLTVCSFLDSRGLGALVAAKERLERSDRSLALVLSNAIVMRIFQITGFDECFEIRSSLRAAGNGNGHGAVPIGGK
jgi:anti-sigma B factor antagonist